MSQGTPSTGLAVVGATGSGKSAAVLALAARRSVEIVSCDSVQAVRGFDCGSAKPSPAERARVPHHGVDVTTWDAPLTAAGFVDMAEVAIFAARDRGALPVVCGGTGLYLRALRRGLAPLPACDPDLRAALAAAERAAPGSNLRALAALDPATAARIDTANPRRVQRALEICHLTGEPASVVLTRPRQRPRVRLAVLWLVWPDAALRARLKARAAQMAAAGLLAEVAALLADGVPPDCAPMRSVGYRQAVAQLRGEAPAAELVDRIVVASWQYARRQRTWLRREPDVCVAEVDSAAAAAAAVAAAAARL